MFNAGPAKFKAKSASSALNRCGHDFVVFTQSVFSDVSLGCFGDVLCLLWGFCVVVAVFSCVVDHIVPFT